MVYWGGLSIFVLTFVCLLDNLVFFFMEDGGATGMGGAAGMGVQQEWEYLGDQEVN